MGEGKFREFIMKGFAQVGDKVGRFFWLCGGKGNQDSPLTHAGAQDAARIRDWVDTDGNDIKESVEKDTLMIVASNLNRAFDTTGIGFQDFIDETSKVFIFSDLQETTGGPDAYAVRTPWWESGDQPKPGP